MRFLVIFPNVPMSYTLPLGVIADIVPFNFPAMIPLWMFPISIACGNTSIIKPSERDPGATILLMEMLNEIGRYQVS